MTLYRQKVQQIELIGKIKNNFKNKSKIIFYKKRKQQKEIIEK